MNMDTPIQIGFQVINNIKGPDEWLGIEPSSAILSQ